MANAGNYAAGSKSNHYSEIRPSIALNGVPSAEGRHDLKAHASVSGGTDSGRKLSRGRSIKRAFSLSPRLFRKRGNRQADDGIVSHRPSIILSRMNSMTVKNHVNVPAVPSRKNSRRYVAGSAPTLSPPSYLETQLSMPSSHVLLTQLLSSAHLLRREVSLLAHSISNPSYLMKDITLIQEEKAMAQAPQYPIEVSKFPQYVIDRKKKRVLFKGEFLVIKRSMEEHAIEFATRKENVDKNGFRDVLPFDYNRVILKPFKNIPDSHYINASYVDSFYQPKAYIVSQACKTKHGCDDFWRMVWEQETNCIVMLTKIFDFMKVMCLQYFPITKQTYGDVIVEVLETVSFAYFVIRTMQISKADRPPRIVMHFHYTEWELNGFPYVSAFLDFRRRIRLYLEQCPAGGPLVVHCSNGGSRSGIFLAVDANLELAQEENIVDVFGYCKTLVNSRGHLVHYLDSYIFIYDVLLEAMLCDISPFPMDELQAIVTKYMMVKDSTQENQYSKEFKMLNQLSPSLRIGDCAGGHRLENRGKNRDVMVVPPDNARPYLNTLHGESKDYTYINAVYSDGFHRKNEWVVTEWPKHHTIDSLWALIYDHNCHTLICLSNQGIPKLYPKFVHDKGKAHYGPFQVEILQYTSYAYMTSHTIKLIKRTFMLSEVMNNEQAAQDQETRICQIFTTKLWPIENKVPLSTSGLIDLIKHARSWQARQTHNPKENRPTIVMSHNGVSRCGIYISANSVIDEMETDQEIDIFHAVKAIRTHRPQLVDCRDEYKYIYDLILTYYISTPEYKQRHKAYTYSQANNVMHNHV